VEGVKKALVAAGSLLAAILAAGESVEVRQATPVQASRHVRVTVLLNRLPVKHAKVDFCEVGSTRCSSVVTGDDGVAIPSRLRDGDYAVVVVSDDDLSTDLYLHVSGKGKTSSFPIDLTASLRAFQKVIAAASNLPIRERVQGFRGSLRDPSGATIPGAKIKIVRRVSEDNAVVQRLWTDKDGHFSASLSDGEYVAFFSCQGFRTEIVPFEVSNQGKTEMQVKLQVGQSSESVELRAQE
jgi:hypothetical protein